MEWLEESPDWCHSCLKVEPLPEIYHNYCGVCGHVYVTIEDLESAHIAEWRSLGLSIGDLEVHQIYTCPLCGHDL